MLDLIARSGPRGRWRGRAREKGRFDDSFSDKTAAAIYREKASEAGSLPYRRFSLRPAVTHTFFIGPFQISERLLEIHFPAPTKVPVPRPISGSYRSHRRRLVLYQKRTIGRNKRQF